eukprot:5715187-Prymnesium_polylepis.1
MAYGLWCAVRRCRALRGSASTHTCYRSTYMYVPWSPPRQVPGFHGLWPTCTVRCKAVLGRYAALRCLWHKVHDDERSNR